MSANPFELAGRLKKVKALSAMIDELATSQNLDPFRQGDLVVERVIDRLAPTAWAVVSEMAGVNLPSADTIAQIRSDYLERARISARVNPSNLYRFTPNSAERI